MTLQKIVAPLVGLALLIAAWNSYRWLGVAFVATGIVMFLLLHFNRTMTVLKRAADRPMGYVGSAVMLNAKLKPKSTLLHVIAMTRSLGELRSAKDEQPEVYRWTDAGGSFVDATFAGGKLVQWQLTRPPQDEAGEPATAMGDLPPG